MSVAILSAAADIGLTWLTGFTMRGRSAKVAETVTIGGGAIGLALAYHLGRSGASGVTLLESNRLTSGTGWHAAWIVGPLRATLNMTKPAVQALELFARLESEAAMSIGYRTTGGYWLARKQDRLDELKRIGAVGDYIWDQASHN